MNHVDLKPFAYEVRLWLLLLVMQALGEPVWRQLLQLHLNHYDPQVAHQAATALAE
jgi:hypothetical protein